MEFQQDWPKDKKIQLFYFLAENFEKFISTELYGTPLEGLTFFLYRISLGRKSLLISGLGGLKYAMSAG